MDVEKATFPCSSKQFLLQRKHKSQPVTLIMHSYIWFQSILIIVQLNLPGSTTFPSVNWSLLLYQTAKTMTMHSCSSILHMWNKTSRHLIATICVPFLLCRNLVYVKKWIVSLRYDRLKLIWYDEHQFTFIGWYQESSQWFSTGSDGNHWINIAS